MPVPDGALTGEVVRSFRKDKKVGEGTYAVVYLGEHSASYAGLYNDSS